MGPSLKSNPGNLGLLCQPTTSLEFSRKGGTMGNTIGILIFDGAEEMDFVGPW